MGNTFVVMKPLLNCVMKAVGMTTQLVEIEPGTTMHFWVPIHHKSKPKPAVVLVHGFVSYGIITWLFQVLALSSDFSVYVPDLLFFGDSFTHRPQRSTNFQADCLAKGMMKLGVEKFSLVGLSYGGMVGFKLAQIYPHMVQSMVMSSTVIELTHSISNASLNNIGFTNWSDFLLPETISDLKLLLSIGTHKLSWLPHFFYTHFLQVMFTNRKEKAELLEALVVADNEAAPTNYSQRIYILCGDDDKIFNMTVSDIMKEKLGEKASLEYIKGAGHLVQLERPSTYNDCLNKFLCSAMIN